MNKKQMMALIIGVAVYSVSFAEENQLDEVYVTGGENAIKTTPGSAHLLDKTQLEKFEYTDIHRVLGSVPGVYMRTEDGYGLRPNIGMRGAPSERSQKITIMEDGMLIGPAPYSAPSAYYFPNIARMEGVEVFKGPVSIKYGPNTVGGAINLVSTTVPEKPKAEAEISGGADNFYKVKAKVGGTTAMGNNGRIGALAEVLRYGSDGFKTLNNESVSGFVRNDVNAKFRYTTANAAKYFQRVDFKLGYADEVSDETYLGLTDRDFAKDPYQRYTASQRDKMVTEHKQVHVTHLIEFSHRLSLTTRAYQNKFERSWNKFENFHNPLFSVNAILANPTGLGEQKYYDLLTGSADSNGTDLQKIDITNNQRSYISRGVELSLNLALMRGVALHEIEMGFRMHTDEVERHHSLKTYDMTGGELVSDEITRPDRLKNHDKTYALSLYVKDKIYLDQWEITAGLRGELIRSTHLNLQDSAKNNVDYTSVIIPGAGVFYQFTDNLGFLLGVNKGFSPNGPSAVDNIDPEESVNTEAGFRYQLASFKSEFIGFYNRYSNLIGRCRVSDTCDTGDEFNGGRVDILGAEVSSQYTGKINHWELPVGLTYTITDSAFQDSFSSGFSQWGDVMAGDELPYLPKHQVRLEFGLNKAKWHSTLAVKYVSAMREKAGQASMTKSNSTMASTVWDLTSSYQLTKALKLQLTVDNVLDDVSIVSRRPFGARPNKPRSMLATVKYGI